MRLTPYILGSLASGAVWGVIAWMLWPRSPGPPPLWGALAVAPLIGLMIGLAFRRIHRLPTGGRIALSLVSLYVAATAFGLVLGLSDLVRLRALGANVRASGVVLQAIPAVLWGLTFTGYVLFLWPLAYWNHHLLGKVSD